MYAAAEVCITQRTKFPSSCTNGTCKSETLSYFQEILDFIRDHEFIEPKVHTEFNIPL